MNTAQWLILIKTCTKTPKLNSKEVFLAIATVSFDISVYELFGPLTVGAKLVILPDKWRADGTAIHKLCQAEKVTAMLATPSLMAIAVKCGVEREFTFQNPHGWRSVYSGTCERTLA